MIEALMVVAILVMMTIAVLGTEILLLLVMAALVGLAIGALKLLTWIMRGIAWACRQIMKAGRA